MRTIEWSVRMGLQGCKQTGTLEVEDESTDEEIDEDVKDQVMQAIEWGWKEKD